MHGSIPVDSEVLIVGAGASGLYAAYLLHQADVSFTVLEAKDHAGGRVHSRPEKFSHLGLVLDEGANLINSTDSLAIRLMDRFNITYVRRLKAGSDSMNYIYGGDIFDQAAFDRLLFQDSRIAINHMLHDQEIWRADKERDFNPKFIDESIATYLARIESGPVLRTMLKSFFWSEYGHSIDELNLHVLFDYLELELSGPAFRLIPNVDEAYTVPDGLGQIADELEQIVHPHVHYGCRVNEIMEENGYVSVKAVDATGLERTHTARHIFFSAPLHVLAHMNVKIEGLSQHAIDQAQTASYASGTKLHLKFAEGYENIFDYSGIILTDTGEQIWTSGTGQSGAGLLTVLTGPMPEGRAAAVAHAGRVLLTLDRVYPKLSDFYVGVERTDAPMSYSGSLRPGEIAHLAIHNGGIHWTTIGEASSRELQGYLEGALRSAEDGVTKYLLKKRVRRRETSRVAQP
jgi:monoamine oxidase